MLSSAGAKAVARTRRTPNSPGQSSQTVVLASNEKFDQDEYFERLTRYSDDGFTLSAPQRYSVADWYQSLVTLPGSFVLGRISSHLIFNVVWACVVSCVSFLLPPNELSPLPSLFHQLDLYLPFQLTGGILGILLAFRTSQSYERFWHGRMLWARVVNRVRSLSRFSAAYLETQDPKVNALIQRWLASFPVALKQHLRGERAIVEFEALTPRERRTMEACDNMPVAVCLALSEILDKVKGDEKSSPLIWWQLEANVMDLMDAIGDGEAIAGTPVPLSYSRHTSRLLSLWTIFMPCVLVTALPPLAVPPSTLLISWMLLATEEIGHIIEEPFGLHNDRPQVLPLQRYCNVIQQDLIQINGRKNEMREVVEATRERMSPYGVVQYDEEDHMGLGSEEEDMPLYEPPPTEDEQEPLISTHTRVEEEDWDDTPNEPPVSSSSSAQGGSYGDRSGRQQSWAPGQGIDMPLYDPPPGSTSSDEIKNWGERRSN